MKRACVTVVILAAALAILAVSGAGQQSTKPRSVSVESLNVLSPVLITKVAVGNRDVQCGLWSGPNAVQPVEPFEEDGDWLKNMTIYLLNRTEKRIVHAQIGIGFPETGDGRSQPQATYLITLGRLPDTVAFTSNGQPMVQDASQRPLPWRAGHVLQIRVAHHLDQIQSLLHSGANVSSMQDVSLATKCFIYLGPFQFEDGTKWSGGAFRAPDVQHQGKFVKEAPDYFPGKPYQIWPRGSGPRPVS